MITITVGPLSLLQARPYTETLVERFEPVAQNTGVFGAGMVGMAMMVPNLNFAGGAPNSQAAGTAGGGGLPTDGSISTAALSLALVPLGLAAVAIFPPFERLVKFTVSFKTRLKTLSVSKTTSKRLENKNP